MFKILAVFIASFISLSAFAQSPNCQAKAAEKKLAGAAKTSFMKKCERESGEVISEPVKACEAKAVEKKLAGAAKNSFVKKCIKDASGS